MVNSKENTIPVVFASDINYVMPLTVAIISILKHAHLCMFHFYILCDKETKERLVRLVKPIQERYSFAISYLEMDESMMTDMKPLHNYSSKAVYYRLFIAELLTGYKKCIYLDCDVYVNMNLLELYDIELGDNYAAGRRDVLTEVWDENSIRAYEQLLQLDSLTDYMNSGVLLLNLEQIRKDEISSEMIAAMGSLDEEKGNRFPDQDILNMFFKGRIVYLENRFNTFAETLDEMNVQDKIIHYAGEGIRPWNNPTARGAGLWWQIIEEYNLVKELGEESCLQLESKKLNAYEIYKLTKGKKKVIICGFIHAARELCDVLQKNGVEVIAFYDNDKKKQEEKYRNVPVMPFTNANESTIQYVVTARRSMVALRNQLRSLGIKDASISLYQWKGIEELRSLSHKYYLREFRNLLFMNKRDEHLLNDEDLILFIHHLIREETREADREIIEKYQLKKWIFLDYFTKEEKAVLDCFEHKIINTHTRICLYGVGPKTRLLLNCFKSDQIIGVMCQNIDRSNICGTPVLTEVTAVENKISNIIVVSRIVNYRIIYERILPFCIQNQICIIGLNGIDLMDWYGVQIINHTRREYFNRSADELERQILNHEIISFDVFDTLIMRKTLCPQDVFYIVGNKAKNCGISVSDFHRARIDAERNNRYEDTIYGIYRTLKENCNLTESEVRRLLQLELEIEKSVLIPRMEMVNLFQKALNAGKKVYLISDMYLPNSIMKELLNSMDIAGYEKVFVSCDYGVNKGSGLFDIYKDEVKGKSYLHIGDNEGADGIYAAKAGLDYYLIRSAKDMLEISPFAHLQNHIGSLNEKNMIGLLISKLFNDPFALHENMGSVTINSIEYLGFTFFGIYAVTFFQWLASAMKEEQIDQMLFPARDGYLFYELYQWLKSSDLLGELPDAVYFLTSRKVCYLSSYRTVEDIDFMLHYACEDYAPEELLLERFNLKREQIIEYSEEQFASIREYVLFHANQIIHNSEVVRHQYIQYLESCGITSGKKYGLFDSYCNGTVQYLLEQFTDYSWVGMYLGKIEGYLSLRNVKSIFKQENAFTSDNDINEKGVLMESVFTSLEPSLKGMESDGFVYAEETRTKKELEYVEKIQQGIAEYVKDYYTNLYIPNNPIKKEIPNVLIHILDNCRIGEECQILNHIYVQDDMGKQKYQAIEKAKL